MKLSPPPKLRPGDELTTGWLNWVLAWTKRNTIEIGVDSGLSMVQTENGTILRVANKRGEGQMAFTHGVITARVAAVPGTGNVFLVNYDGNELVTGTVDVEVISYSSTTGGIPDDTYCWIAQDPQGNWVITSVDCGN